ncbi:MAG: type II toxin-antitoxin system RelB/DinJ family antitoxin [Peptoniphilus sp.]|uniref:type II toxin-antitoxin system RelB/DinJ family antitoxin n=1 Tax=Peptoniphilus sp. TaxID=1971214 RepID=UPI00399B0590
MAELIIDVDDDLLEEVKKVCEDKGLTIDDAINIFLKNLADDGKLSDEILENLFYCDENIEYLERKYREYKKGKLKDIIISKTL